MDRLKPRILVRPTELQGQILEHTDENAPINNQIDPTLGWGNGNYEV